ncbi:MAG: SAM-dependent methyltransferase [Geodermatophilaceae bacterium]
MRPWREAMTEALYGAGGFYLRPEGPAAHFRTSAHTGSVYAATVAELLGRVDLAIGHPAQLDLVDVGAGRGELLHAVADLAAQGLPFAARLRLTGVEVAARPRGLPARIGWADEIPPVTGLLLANEWLDVVPVDVVELTTDGPRLVLVDATGRESLGGPPTAADLAWLTQWWPLPLVGQRAEIGSTRDAAWANAVSRVRRGLAVAVDYGHTAEKRPPYGSLVGYRAGAVVPPIPDGSCDLTAHVALDSCLAAAGILSTQRDVLAELGVSAAHPPRELAARDPAAYLAALRSAGEATELLDPGGLGGFGWLLHGVGMAVPLCPPERLGSDRPEPM